MGESSKQTIDRLTRENEDLRARLQQAGAAGGTAAPRPAPQPPSFGLSEGERQDLAQHGVTRSAFTGDELLADEKGVEPANDEARDRQERHRQAREARDTEQQQQPQQQQTTTFPRTVVPEERTGQPERTGRTDR